MNDTYRFGDRLNDENYEALRKLAQNLPYKDFCEATGFKQGIHTRLRKFSRLQEYKNYIADNRSKYVQENGQKVTLKDIYNKLDEFEESILKIFDFTNKNVFICKGPNAMALGVKWGPRRFWVLKHSLARFEKTDSFKTYKNKKDRLIDKKILVPFENQNKSYFFTQNVLFDSPSAASGVVLSRESDGLNDWKTISGITLGEIERIKKPLI